jgi:hypothetical protein
MAGPLAFVKILQRLGKRLQRRRFGLIFDRQLVLLR